MSPGSRSTSRPSRSPSRPDRRDGKGGSREWTGPRGGAPEGPGGIPDSPRARGMAKMEEVYGFSVDPDQIAGPLRRLHRRPPVRCGVDPARARHPRPPADDHRGAGRPRPGPADGDPVPVGPGAGRADRGAGPRDRAPPGPLHRLAAVDRASTRWPRRSSPSATGRNRERSAAGRSTGGGSVAPWSGSTSPARWPS